MYAWGKLALEPVGVLPLASVGADPGSLPFSNLTLTCKSGWVRGRDKERNAGFRKRVWQLGA